MAELLSSEQLNRYLLLVGRFRPLRSGAPIELKASPPTTLAVEPSAPSSSGTVALPLIMPVGSFFAQTAWSTGKAPAQPIPKTHVTQPAEHTKVADTAEVSAVSAIETRQWPLLRL